MPKNRPRFPQFPRFLWLGILGLAWLLAGVASWRAILTSTFGQ
ncbi:hypothetical protein [Gloeomargarita lithophora]|nr:hypothetical protein [Gloeomargarita lithophora]